MATLVLKETDADTTHDVERGDHVELRLPENPSTGYRWSIDVEPPEAAAIIATHWSPVGAGVGAAGIRAFEISIDESGAMARCAPSFGATGKEKAR